VNDDDVIVEPAIGGEKVALTVLVAATPVAFAAGLVAVTGDAGVVTAAVVKLHVTGLASGVPSLAFTVVSIAAV
jgi:hypothetical protein